MEQASMPDPLSYSSSVRKNVSIRKHAPKQIGVLGQLDVIAAEIHDWLVSSVKDMERSSAATFSFTINKDGKGKKIDWNCMVIKVMW